MIERRIFSRVAELRGRFPAVVLIGPRQVGKITLAKRCAANADGVYLCLLENLLLLRKLKPWYKNTGIQPERIGFEFTPAMRCFACGGAGMNITVGDRAFESHGGLRLMPAVLDIINRILKNFSWLAHSLFTILNSTFKRSAYVAGVTF